MYSQGEGIRVRGIDEVQETDQCPEIRFEPDSQPSVHLVVVSHHQPSERVRRFPGQSDIPVLLGYA